MKEPVGERPIMPDYGVQDAEDWQALPWSWAAAKLAAARNFWLCTASVTGQPHALPLWGVWDEATHRFCFSCGPRSRKAADVAANPHVAFAPEDTVECVSVEGTAAVIADPRLQYWISLYRAKYGRGVSEPPSAQQSHGRSHPRTRVRDHRAGTGIQHPRDSVALRLTLSSRLGASPTGATCLPLHR